VGWASEGSRADLPTVGLPEAPSPGPTTVAEHAYAVEDGAGAPLGLATWRVVQGTGNCCENYLAAGPDGRLLDLGGGYIYFTDDRGLTWQRVGVVDALGGDNNPNGGEGGLVVAPDGDVVGFTWSPDVAASFKYDAQAGQWYRSEALVHPPLADRPWVAMAPGPFGVAGQQVPYVSVFTATKGGRDFVTFSLDGLNYLVPSQQSLDALLVPPVQAWLTQPADPMADWTQSNSYALVYAMPGGGAIAARTTELLTTGCAWRVLTPSLQWACHHMPSGPDLAEGRVAFDSLGRLHHLAWLDSTRLQYRISGDGGQSWGETNFTLPPSHRIEDWDFKANAALGFAAVAVHAHNDASGKDQDLVLRIGLAGPAPALQRTYFVGAGDLDAGVGVGAAIRFDFATVVILADGGIATSFIDAAHNPPAVAVLLQGP